MRGASKRDATAHFIPLLWGRQGGGGGVKANLWVSAMCETRKLLFGSSDL